MGTIYAGVYFTHGLVDFVIDNASEEYAIQRMPVLYVFEDDEFGCPPFISTVLAGLFRCLSHSRKFKNEILKSCTSLVAIYTARSFVLRLW